ncbi:MAG TPA: IS1634 family transposase [Steroidobacteraceae bacterium]|nr:IS1634 family transposase [Steroidobacteraceae bacterium]
MYVAVIPNRGSPPAILLRESYREAGKTKNRTLANLSRWPAERIEQLRAVLRGDQLLPAIEAVEIVRALPHGHVLAALGTARRIALDAVLPRRAPQRRRDLALALIVARLLEPAAKLATARMLDPATASHSLGEMLGLGRVAAKEVYAALDWLGREQPFIEATLARRHLKDGALLLYDVTSTYLEGRCCELAQYGYSRDHRADRPQIVIGLMCTGDGCPVAVEVFEGNTADPMTLSAQIDKLKQRFRLQRVVMVGDRGLLTSARIEQTLRPAGLDWITALRAPAIKQLAAEGGPLQPSLFDDRDMPTGQARGLKAHEITSPDYPGERLVVCKNPLLTEERARKRAELLAATEKELARIAARVQRTRSPLRGTAAIGQAVCAVLGRRHMAEHFQISIGEDAIIFAQNTLSIAAEAALDGIYVVRTNLPAEHSDAAATVRAYKSLSGVEHAFRSLKTVDLELRAVFHWTAPRVRAHVLLCMLAYYLQWHMRRSLAPMLFDEPDPAARQAQRTSPVAKAEASPAAHRKAARKRTDPVDGEPLPVHSFHTLLADLATLTRNVVRLGRDRLTAILATPTRTQHRALDLLGLTPTA